jgi:hypothetical protein
MEAWLGRVINPDAPGKSRNSQIKIILFSIRELMKQTKPDLESKDLAAFIGLTLLDIFYSVDQSVIAWEKRGYWLKADRFRMEWEWTNRVGKELCDAVKNEDWGIIADRTAYTAQKFSNTTIPKTNKMGPVWKGSYDRLLNLKILL